MSVTLQVDMAAVERLGRRVEQLAKLDTRSLMDALGAEVETQTRRRIAEEKESPDGTPWPAWSKAYAATRHPGQSLLVGDGDLEDSVQYVVGLAGDHTEIGSNLVYAAIHQLGGEDVGMGIPAREYIGLSPENEADLEVIIDDWVDDQLRAL